MKILSRSVYVFVLIALGGFIAHAASEPATPPIHIVTSGSDLKWGPPPPMIPKCEGRDPRRRSLQSRRSLRRAA